MSDAFNELIGLSEHEQHKINGNHRLPVAAGGTAIIAWQKVSAYAPDQYELRKFQRACVDVCQRVGGQFSEGEARARLKKLAATQSFFGASEQDIETAITEQIALCENVRHPERRGVSASGEPLHTEPKRRYRRQAENQTYYSETVEHRSRIEARTWERGPDHEADEPQARREHEQPQKPLDEWDAGDDPGKIPPRQWLLGNQFCRGFISSIVAAGGAGKTALRLLQFISMATGRSLCGQHVFRRSRVLLISLEDDSDELQRRIKAVPDHYNIDRRELKGWLFCASPKLAKLAEMKNRTRTIGPLEQQIRDAIARRNPDIVGLDPFIKTHSLEENASGDMDFVCDLLARIAVEFNVAVDCPHHVHKGQLVPGDADSGRGSSGIRDAGRLVYTLVQMSEDEAKAFNINPEERYSYIRLDSAKVNIAARSGKATWFRLTGVAIGNGTEEYPSGDTIQVVEPWSPPETWAGLDSALLNRILSTISDGLGDGNYYTAANSATDRAAWKVVQRFALEKSEAQCRDVIRAWLKSGLLVQFGYTSPATSKPVKGLKVDDTKRPT